MKPGQSTNISNPERSADSGIRDATLVGSGSRQDAATAQLSNNPNRMRPAGTADYRAEVEVSGVLEGQTADRTASTKVNYANRKRLFSA